MESDRFLLSFNASDREIAEEFLTTWLPFLTKDLCNCCSDILRDRIRSLNTGSLSNRGIIVTPLLFICHARVSSFVCSDNRRFLVSSGHDSYHGNPQAEEIDVRLKGSLLNGEDENLDVSISVGECVRGSPESCDYIEPMDWNTDQEEESHKVSMSWADIAQQDELEEERKNILNDVRVEEKRFVNLKKIYLSREQRERIRFTCVGRKMDFISLERIDGKTVNILEGLELHTEVFSAAEQRRIVDFVYDLQAKGKNNEFGGKIKIETFFFF